MYQSNYLNKVRFAIVKKHRDGNVRQWKLRAIVHFTMRHIASLCNRKKIKSAQIRHEEFFKQFVGQFKFLGNIKYRHLACNRSTSESMLQQRLFIPFIPFNHHLGHFRDFHGTSRLSKSCKCSISHHHRPQLRKLSYFSKVKKQSGWIS